MQELKNNLFSNNTFHTLNHKTKLSKKEGALQDRIEIIETSDTHSTSVLDSAFSIKTPSKDSCTKIIAFWTQKKRTFDALLSGSLGAGIGCAVLLSKGVVYLTGIIGIVSSVALAVIFEYKSRQVAQQVKLFSNPALEYCKILESKRDQLKNQSFNNLFTQMQNPDERVNLLNLIHESEIQEIYSRDILKCSEESQRFNAFEISLDAKSEIDFLEKFFHANLFSKEKLETLNLTHAQKNKLSTNYEHEKNCFEIFKSFYNSNSLPQDIKMKKIKSALERRLINIQSLIDELVRLLPASSQGLANNSKSNIFHKERWIQWSHKTIETISRQPKNLLNSSVIKNTIENGKSLKNSVSSYIGKQTEALVNKTSKFVSELARNYHLGQQLMKTVPIIDPLKPYWDHMKSPPFQN